MACAVCKTSTLRFESGRRLHLFNYFIPLIPLDTVADYVECQYCKGTFKDAVLSYDPRAQQEAFRQQFEQALQRAMVLTMLADGNALRVSAAHFKGIVSENSSPAA
jgi:hypothetical protein